MSTSRKNLFEALIATQHLKEALDVMLTFALRVREECEKEAKKKGEQIEINTDVILEFIEKEINSSDNKEEVTENGKGIKINCPVILENIDSLQQLMWWLEKLLLQKLSNSSLTTDERTVVSVCQAIFSLLVKEKLKLTDIKDTMNIYTKIENDYASYSAFNLDRIIDVLNRAKNMDDIYFCGADFLKIDFSEAITVSNKINIHNLLLKIKHIKILCDDYEINAIFDQVAREFIGKEICHQNSINDYLKPESSKNEPEWRKKLAKERLQSKIDEELIRIENQEDFRKLDILNHLKFKLIEGRSLLQGKLNKLYIQNEKKKVKDERVSQKIKILGDAIGTEESSVTMTYNSLLSEINKKLNSFEPITYKEINSLSQRFDQLATEKVIEPLKKYDEEQPFLRRFKRWLSDAAKEIFGGELSTHATLRRVIKTQQTFFREAKEEMVLPTAKKRKR